MNKMSWREVMSALADMTEEEAQQRLDDEIQQHKRPAVARRLHQRLCTLRAIRERKEIMKEIKK